MRSTRSPRQRPQERISTADEVASSCCLEVGQFQTCLCMKTATTTLVSKAPNPYIQLTLGSPARSPGLASVEVSIYSRTSLATLIHRSFQKAERAQMGGWEDEDTVTPRLPLGCCDQSLLGFAPPNAATHLPSSMREGVEGRYLGNSVISSRVYSFDWMAGAAHTFMYSSAESHRGSSSSIYVTFNCQFDRHVWDWNYGRGWSWKSGCGEWGWDWEWEWNGDADAIVEPWACLDSASHSSDHIFGFGYFIVGAFNGRCQCGHESFSKCSLIIDTSISHTTIITFNDVRYPCRYYTLSDHPTLTTS